jgi:uncharacterized membrane protein
MSDEPADLGARHDLSLAAGRLRDQHVRETHPLQRAVDRLTAVVGWPGFVGVLIAAIALWILGNLAITALGGQPVDPPPFFWLQDALAAGALIVAALILTTQRREDQLSSHRGQLVLELAILNDQKCSKIIELLEESRRDNPMIGNRDDEEARTMSTPADANLVLGAIKEAPRFEAEVPDDVP